MDDKSSLARCFVILGGLLRCLIFVGKKWDTNPDKSRPAAKRVRPPVILGRRGGMCGASGGLEGVQKLEELEQKLEDD